MKHLKKFNEEYTNPEVYRSAGNQLRRLGHKGRGDRLHDHADQIGKNKTLRNIDTIRKKYEQFGTLGLDISEGLADWDFEEKGDFNFIIQFDDGHTGDTYERGDDLRESIQLYFWIGLIPTNEYVNHLFDEYDGVDREFLRGDIEKGFIFVTPFQINFDVGLDHFKLSDINIMGGSEYGEVQFRNRSSANKFKSTLAKIFARRVHYPCVNSTNDETSEIESIFSELDILADYGMEVKDVSKLIQKFSINNLKWAQ